MPWRDDLEWTGAADDADLALLQAAVVITLGGKSDAWEAAVHPATAIRHGTVPVAQRRMVEALVVVAVRLGLDPARLSEPTLPLAVYEALVRRKVRV